MGDVTACRAKGGVYDFIWPQHPASQILRELMREFVQRQRQAREYEEFLHGKVASARVQIRAGEYASVDDLGTLCCTKRSVAGQDRQCWRMKVFWAGPLPLSKTVPTSLTEAKPHGVMPAANRWRRCPSERTSASNWFQSSGG